jgi:hypothetical protein
MSATVETRRALSCARCAVLSRLSKLGSVSSRSPDYEATKGDLPGQFEALEVKAELLSFALIGHDDEFAVGRAKIKTVGTPKSANFTDNTIDSILVFHQDGGVWKLWAEEILGVELLP